MAQTSKACLAGAVVVARQIRNQSFIEFINLFCLNQRFKEDGAKRIRIEEIKNAFLKEDTTVLIRDLLEMSSAENQSFQSLLNIFVQHLKKDPELHSVWLEIMGDPEGSLVLEFIPKYLSYPQSLLQRQIRSEKIKIFSPLPSYDLVLRRVIELIDLRKEEKAFYLTVFYPDIRREKDFNDKMTLRSRHFLTKKKGSIEKNV